MAFAAFGRAGSRFRCGRRRSAIVLARSSFFQDIGLVSVRRKPSDQAIERTATRGRFHFSVSCAFSLVRTRALDGRRSSNSR